MLAGGTDNAMLRYTLGGAYLKAGNPAKAAAHLETAVELDPQYSAAWKLLGKARVGIDDAGGAALAYRTGIEAAETRGDVQAAKEMRVFLRRLESRR